MRLRNVAVVIGAVLPLFSPNPSGAQTAQPCEEAICCEGEQQVVRIGAVAYAPEAVTIFEGIRRYLGKNGMAVDYVLYSNYDALVEALHSGQVDIAWNTPLAHARYHLRAGGQSQTLVMRDVDCDFRSVLVARKDAEITSTSGLRGKTLILGSRDAAEATVLPDHYLKQEGLDLSEVKVQCLDGEVDLQGNPCSGERHVLQALLEGRGDAGVIGQQLWERIERERPEHAEALMSVWVSPPFSHCVFTAPACLDETLAKRFTKLMTAMDPSDPMTADIMRLEGTKKWVAGNPDDFADLLDALQSSR